MLILLLITVLLQRLASWTVEGVEYLPRRGGLGLAAADGPNAGNEQLGAVVVPEEFLLSRLPKEPDVVKCEIEREIAQVSRQLAPYKKRISACMMQR